MTAVTQQSLRVPSDKWVVFLFLGYWLAELPRALLGSVGAISDQSLRVLEVTTHVIAGGLFAALVFQGSYFWRLGRREWRWRFQLIGCCAALVIGALAAISLSNQLQKDVDEFVNRKPAISSEKLSELLAKPDTTPEQKVSLSKYVASSTYVYSGELRMVSDEHGRWSEYRPTASDMDMRRTVVRLKAGGIRPTYQEVTGVVALLACLLAAVAGYVRAVQFSNRAP